MAAFRSPPRIALLFSLALLLAGIWIAYVEAKSYFSGGDLPLERFEALAKGSQIIGMSTTSKRLVLDNCLDGVVAVHARTQPPEKRDRVAEECRSVVDEIVARTPAYSYAWYVGAVAASRLGDTKGVVDRLRQSQVTGPTEQWIAELRVGLAETYLADLPVDVRMQHDRDLALLVASDRGVRAIAARYVRDPDFRDRITTIVEQMPQRSQQRFLFNVQRAAGA